MPPVRTRIEPAPSGSIHVGNARTALYNWLFTRRHGGSFVLRIADTDKKRATEENYQAVLEDFAWLGLDWDEGPQVGGDYGPYRQSARFAMYDEHVEKLLSNGAAYRCYCTPEELEAERKKAQAEGRAPGYSGRCRALSTDEVARFEAEDRDFSIRFAVPEARTIAFDDIVRGRIATETRQIQDFVIRRSDGSPTYQLAVTVDDLLMQISHVIRGEDLMASTPRQLLIRAALGAEETPVFAHLPLLVAPDGRPLSKRWGDVAVRAYRDQGFLPEAMINYLALLGWSFDDRTNIFSRAELVEKFSLERVGRNPASFDVAKLEWLNGHYIRSSKPEELAEQLVPFCTRAGLPADTPEGREILVAVAPLLVERLKRLDAVPPMIRFFFERVTPDEKAAKVLEGQSDYLDAAAARLEAVGEWSKQGIEGALRGLAEKRGLKPKQGFQPIRAAVTGTLVSPPLFESLELLGRDESLARLRARATRPVP